MRNRNQSQLGHVHFHALGAGYRNLLWILIGSLGSSGLQWLTIVFASVLVSKQSIEKASRKLNTRLTLTLICVPPPSSANGSLSCASHGLFISTFHCLVYVPCGSWWARSKAYIFFLLSGASEWQKAASERVRFWNKHSGDQLLSLEDNKNNSEKINYSQTSLTRSIHALLF